MSKRIPITLPDELHERLTSYSQRTGVPIAEAVRRSVSEWLTRKEEKMTATALTFDRINEQTGFANGEKFASEAEVREYFTPDTQRSMFGADADLSEVALSEMAEAVLANRWHCEF